MELAGISINLIPRAQALADRQRACCRRKIGFKPEGRGRIATAKSRLEVGVPRFQTVDVFVRRGQGLPRKAGRTSMKPHRRQCRSPSGKTAASPVGGGSRSVLPGRRRRAGVGHAGGRPARLRSKAGTSVGGLLQAALDVAEMTQIARRPPCRDAAGGHDLGPGVDSVSTPPSKACSPC